MEKIEQKLKKILKILRNPSKSFEILKNPWKSLKIFEKSLKSLKIPQNPKIRPFLEMWPDLCCVVVPRNKDPATFSGWIFVARGHNTIQSGHIFVA